jgi:hypothetical protein
MKTEILTGNVAKLHDLAAHILAQSYLFSLGKDTQNTFGTLESHVESNWLNIACEARQARPSFSPSIIFRKRHVIEAARWEINQALKANQPLALKLVAIRKAQQAKRDAEIAAEHAAYVPFFALSAN